MSKKRSQEPLYKKLAPMVYAFYMAGFRVEEIKERLNISYDTLYRALKYAKQELKKKYKERLGESLIYEIEKILEHYDKLLIRLERHYQEADSTWLKVRILDRIRWTINEKINAMQKLGILPQAPINIEFINEKVEINQQFQLLMDEYKKVMEEYMKWKEKVLQRVRGEVEKAEG